MNLEVEFSFYPLTEEYLEHPVHDFIEVLEKHGCVVEIGVMSSIVKGDSAQVFDALRIG
jgi:uncharacterized protein YqgV (UPF0045/DUF77 family)